LQLKNENVSEFFPVKAATIQSDLY